MPNYPIYTQRVAICPDCGGEINEETGALEPPMRSSGLAPQPEPRIRLGGVAPPMEPRKQVARWWCDGCNKPFLKHQLKFEEKRGAMKELTIKERAELMRQIFESKLVPMLAAKGEDYSRYASAGNTKANANFGALAEMFKNSELDKYHVWAVFMMKHIQAILTWVSQRKVESEKIEGRFLDAANYIMIGWTMLIEDGIIEPPNSPST